MISPTEFWFEHFGRWLAPDAVSWSEALMAQYPHADEARSVRTRMGGSEPARFLISEHEGMAWAPIRTETVLPDRVTLQQTSERKRRDWCIDVILDPPEPPFLAASVGMSGADASHWRMTTSRDLIAFGGAAALFEGQTLMLVDRRKFVEARDWFVETQVAVSELLRFWDTTHQFQRQVLTGRQARARLDRLKADTAILQAFPGEKSAVLAKLAAYAADGWSRLEEAA